MKSKVMDRPMFKQGMMAVEVEPTEEVDPENVGIMAGFKDMLSDIELPEDEGEDENGTAEMMGRTPDSPEILMNNLRGDMRSVDARKEELADLVGMRAASETPDSVLALLQPVLAGQMMPQMGPPSAPPGMPPMPPGMEPPMPPALPPGMQPPMPAGPPPMAPPMPGGGIGSLPKDQGPVQMAQGGFVQRFSEGTTGPDEDQDGGVSPLNTDAVSYPPELTERARTEVLNFLVNKKPIAVPDLASETARRQTVYQNLLGRDKGMTQAQILFDIAQGGLNMAAGVDAEGRPLRGPQSAVSRFSSAFSKVPGQIGARVGEQAKEDRAIKLAAMQAAEKSISDIRQQKADLVKEQAKGWMSIYKEQFKSNPEFGKSLEGIALKNWVDLAPAFARGETTEEQNRRLDASLSVLRKTETYTNPEDGRTYTRRTPLPQFIQDAYAANSRIPTGGFDEGFVPSVTPPAAVAPAGAAPAAAPTAAPAAAAPAAAPTAQLGGGLRPVFPLSPAKPVTPSPSTGPSTLLGAAQYGTGLFEVPIGAMYQIPGVGQITQAVVPEAQKMAAAKSQIRAARSAIDNALRMSPKISNDERKDIQSRLDLDPSMLTRSGAYISKLLSLDSYLAEREQLHRDMSATEGLPVKDQNDARVRAQEFRGIRKLVGVMDTPVISSMEQWRELPGGGRYFIWNRNGEYSYLPKY